MNMYVININNLVLTSTINKIHYGIIILVIFLSIRFTYTVCAVVRNS